MNDWLNKTSKFTDKMKEQSYHLYNRANCHPAFKKHVAPVVESILSTTPLMYCVPCPIACCFDGFLLSCPCTFPCEFLWIFAVQIPLNFLSGGYTIYILQNVFVFLIFSAVLTFIFLVILLFYVVLGFTPFGIFAWFTGTILLIWCIFYVLTNNL